MAKYSKMTDGQHEAIVDGLGGEQGVAQFLAGELVVVPKAHQVSAEGLADGGITYAAPVDVQAFLADQRNFYREVYGKKVPRVNLPSQRPGFSWGLVMAPFMTPQWLWDCAREREGIGAWKYDAESLDTLIETNDRNPKDGAYTLWCRNRRAADEEYKGKSRDFIVSAGIHGMTLAEYENLFIWFHYKTGKFLDPTTWTLCTGSLCRDGDVPHGSGRGGGLRVSWDGRDNALPGLRVREVVRSR